MSMHHFLRGPYIDNLGYLVGLQIDCSALVKSGRIKESDMHNRNWAYWTTFCQVGICGSGPAETSGSCLRHGMCAGRSTSVATARWHSPRSPSYPCPSLTLNSITNRGSGSPLVCHRRRATLQVSSRRPASSSGSDEGLWTLCKLFDVCKRTSSEGRCLGTVSGQTFAHPNLQVVSELE